MLVLPVDVLEPELVVLDVGLLVVGVVPDVVVVGVVDVVVVEVVVVVELDVVVDEPPPPPPQAASSAITPAIIRWRTGHACVDCSACAARWSRLDDGSEHAHGVRCRQAYRFMVSRR